MGIKSTANSGRTVCHSIVTYFLSFYTIQILLHSVNLTEKYETGRNILYIDDLNNIQDKIRSIFGEICAFSEDAEM
ncbi:MAG: hypothetical protein RR441_10335 [Longicatena sp.]